VTPQTHPKLDALVGYAINYYRDFVAPTKQFREPSESERKALSDLRDALSNLSKDATAEDIQNVVYEIGRREPFLDPVKKARTAVPASRSTGSTCSTRCCSGRRKARASARSSRSTALRTRSA
jgi:lysyl-tRNA synthetase class I